MKVLEAVQRVVTGSHNIEISPVANGIVHIRTYECEYGEVVSSDEIDIKLSRWKEVLAFVAKQQD